MTLMWQNPANLWDLGEGVPGTHLYHCVALKIFFKMFSKRERSLT